MRRREFIGLLGGAAASWPRAGQAQKAGVPTIGFLTGGNADTFADQLVGFRKGLVELGYVEGVNTRIEYRYSEGRSERYSEMAAELVRRPSQVIFVNGPTAAHAAVSTTSTIPIVFSMGEDPVKEGFVASLNRPNGNITGLTTLTNQLFGKRLQLLLDITPKASPLALLVNPTNANSAPDSRDARAAAGALGRELRVLTARSDPEFDAAFNAITKDRVAVLLVGVDPFFLARRALLASLAIRHGIPTMFDRREYAAAGGLMSYGANYVDAWRQAGVFVGRILRGARPSDLPVQQATKIEFVLNFNTVKALGLEIPPGVIAIADEVIE